MNKKTRIIRDNATFLEQYEHLRSGDIVVGRLRLKPEEEHVLLDMAARGVNLIPSGIAQMCSRSKVFQARILSKFMVPGTVAVYNQHDILALVNEYDKKGFEKVVCKLDRANGGMGILLFSSIEDVYNNAVLGTLVFPFVVQPFIERCQDVRAVIYGELVDSYIRYNPHNFRHNLHCGGSSSPFDLTEDHLKLCLEIMKRAGFSYAHIDLLLDGDGNTWLSEINLRGGLRGSALSQQDFLESIEKIHTAQLESFLE